MPYKKRLLCSSKNEYFSKFFVSSYFLLLSCKNNKTIYTTTKLMYSFKIHRHCGIFT